MPTALLTPGQAVAQRIITGYSLTPEQLHKATALHRTTVELSLASTVWGFAVLAILIAVRYGPSLQHAVERISSRRFLQAAVFVPALLITVSIFELPLEIYGHRVSLAYALSVQGWGSWFADWLKSELLLIVVAMLCLWLFYTLIRRSPRQWWMYGWLCSLPLMFALVFASPVLIDPLFNRFEPLAQTDPELASQLQDLAASAGLHVPSSRIFLMHASDKVTTYNAYVSGFGATKRIVVWDNTARDLTLPQTLFVFAHEMGHYQLDHIYLGLAFSALLALVGFRLTQLLTEAALARFGSRWGIPALGEWASLPVLLLITSALAFAASPFANAFSRWEEHQADRYALAITRPVFLHSGLNPSQIAAQSFQVLGEKSYSYPDPSPLLVFWSYSHPPIAQRIRYALAYGGQLPRRTPRRTAGELWESTPDTKSRTGRSEQ